MSDRLNAMKAPDDCRSIEEIRDAIDSIDHEIVAALGRRFEYVKAIMRFKSTADDVRAPERYRIVLQQRRTWAVEEGLDADVIEQLYRDLIGHFIAHEMAALEGVNADRAPDGNDSGPSETERV